MNTINRLAIVVCPREPYFEWARACVATAPAAVAEVDFTSVYLVNEPDPYDPKKLIRQHYKKIFEEMLNSWYREESRWPARTEARFHQWFDSRVIDIVWDMGRGDISVD